MKSLLLATLLLPVFSTNESVQFLLTDCDQKEIGSFNVTMPNLDNYTVLKHGEVGNHSITIRLNRLKKIENGYLVHLKINAVTDYDFKKEIDTKININKNQIRQVSSLCAMIDNNKIGYQYNIKLIDSHKNTQRLL